MTYHDRNMGGFRALEFKELDAVSGGTIVVTGSRSSSGGSIGNISYGGAGTVAEGAASQASIEAAIQGMVLEEGDGYVTYDYDGDGQADHTVITVTALTEQQQTAQLNVYAGWAAALGIGFGLELYYGPEGLGGELSFMGGFGAYAEGGVASNQDAARAVTQAGDDLVVVGTDTGVDADFGGTNQHFGVHSGFGFLFGDDQVEP